MASAWTPTRSVLNERRWHVLHLRGDKCLSTWQPRPISEVTRLRFSWNWWGGVKETTRAKESQCLPTDPRAIIRYVFPAATEDAALSVSYCETGGTFNVYATNSSSGAAGLFQLMPFHWQGKFNPYNPWANSRYAYQLSSAGYDWGAWVCKP